MEPIRCALYLRISLDATGQQLAITRQREDCRKIATDRGWVTVAEYVDNSISASDSLKARPGYEALLRAYRDRKFDALICYDLDRLTRQPRQLEDWIDAAEKDGLLLVTGNGEADLTTDGGRLFARIKLAVARAEVERKSARQKRAALQRAELGRVPAGVRLTGYATDGTVIPDEAATVRAMFDRFAAGDSLKGIAGWLTEHGVPTRGGGSWHFSTIRTILTNPRYAGRAVYLRQRENGQRGQWEPIVDDATFDLVQAKLADPRRRTQTGTDRRHLGSGLYLCGTCRTPVRAWSGGRYRCPDGCVTRSQPPIDDLIVRVVRARLARPDFADLLAAGRDDTRPLTDTLTRLRTRVTVIEADYDAGLIDGQRYRVATEKVRAEISQVEAQLARVSTGRAWDGVGADPVAAFDAAPLMLRRAMVAGLVVVRLAHVPRGRKGFDPETVLIDPVEF